MNGHHWYHLHGLCRAVRIGKQAKNSKWKYMAKLKIDTKIMWEFQLQLVNCQRGQSKCQLGKWGVLGLIPDGDVYFHYPRATRCGGDIVMLPWFCPCVRQSVSQSVSVSCLNLVNAIATKLLCTSSSNVADMFTMTRGWTLLILEVRGQRSRSQLTYTEISLWTR